MWFSFLFDFQVIYIARNPKDVAVSYFHLHKFFRTLDFKGDFNQFWDFFENDHGKLDGVFRTEEY